jgi:hypothetical protein
VAPGWSNFFFLVGSASAGLIGLMFVVMTLMAGVERSKALRGQAMYMTPTIAHFGAVFAICAVGLAPGLTLRGAALVFGFVALLGLACVGRAVIGFARPTPGSDPHWSDFWLYAALPAVLYAGLIVAAVGALSHAAWAIRAQAGLLLILLLLGIRNAWDLVSWMAPSRPGPGNSELK